MESHKNKRRLVSLMSKPVLLYTFSKHTETNKKMFNFKVNTLCIQCRENVKIPAHKRQALSFSYEKTGLRSLASSTLFSLFVSDKDGEWESFDNGHTHILRHTRRHMTDRASSRWEIGLLSALLWCSLNTFSTRSSEHRSL